MSKDGVHGFIYEAKIAMLFALRAFHNSQSFLLWPQVDGVGKLDDLSFECKEKGRTEYRLLQAKHREKRHKKIMKEQLMTDSDGNFSLTKYFFSYKIATEELSTKGSIKDIILCTNVDFDKAVKEKIVEEVTDGDTILNSRSKVTNVGGRVIKQHTIYKCKEEVASDLKRFMDNRMIIKLAKRLVIGFLSNHTIKHTEDPYKYYHKELLAKEVVDVRMRKFHENFINGNGLTEEAKIFRDAFIKEFKDKVKKKLSFQNINTALKEKDEEKKVVIFKEPIGLNFSPEFGVVEDEEQISAITSTMEKIEEYLKHLLFAVDQCDADLDEIIKTEISEEVDTDIIPQAFDTLFRRMLDWSRGQEESGYFSNEKLEEFFQHFNKELRFDLRDPHGSFIGRKQELKQMHEKLQTEAENGGSQIVALCGLGGIGKSELARKYISQHRKDYGNKTIWINAETNTTLVESFQRLAQDTLAISLKNVDNERKDIKSILEEVYKFFSRGKSLFVFDNAEKLRTRTADDEGIDKFLPPSNTKGSKPHVLITSRNQTWGDFPTLSVNVFTKYEAGELIKKLLVTDCDEDIKKLAEKLQYFPLALQQAIAYIRMMDEDLKNVGGEFKITDYLKEYKDHAKELLNFQFPDDNCNLYTKTTFITWEITTEYIERKENGATALKILNIISYFDPENIRTTMFKSLVNEDMKRLGSSVTLLKQYSMVASGVDSEILSVHRLVQQVIRIKLTPEREKECLKETLSLFRNNIDPSNVDHFVSVWSYVGKHAELVKEFASLATKTVTVLTDNVRYTQAESFGKNSLKLFENILEIDNVNIPEMMACLACILKRRGEYSEALSLYKTIEQQYGNRAHLAYDIGLLFLEQHEYSDALKAFGKSSPRDSIEASWTINSQAKALIGLKKYDEISKMICEFGDKEFKRIRGGSGSILFAFESKVDVLCAQKKYTEALKMSKRIYEGKKKLLGSRDMETLNTRHYVARLEENCGNYELALETWREIYDEMNLLMPDHPRMMIIKLNMCPSLLSLGKLPEAWSILLEYETKCREHPDHLVYFEQITPIKLQDIPEVIMILAAGCGDIQYVDKMLKQGTNVNARCNDGATSLHNAALYDHAEVVDILLEKGADVNLKKANGVTPLHIAARNKNSNIVNALLDKGADVDAADIHGDTPLLRVLKKGCGAYIGASSSCCTEIELKNEVDKALLASATKGRYLDVINILLNRGANVNATTEDGITALCIAACNENVDTVCTLLKKGAAINVDEYSIIPFLKEEIRLVLDSTCSLFTTIVESDVTEDLKFQRLKHYLENGGILGATDNYGWTILHYAVVKNYKKIINFLLEKGADATIVTKKKGNTSLHLAASKGLDEIAKTLLKHVKTVSPDKLNAFVNAKTPKGTTALQVARQNNHNRIAEILLEYRAKPNTENA